MNLDKALEIFYEEARELLGDAETALLALGRNDDAEQAINAVFRAIHTVKGSAGLFPGFESLVEFLHTVESVLVEVRSGDRSMSEDLCATFLSACDHTQNLLHLVEGGGSADPEILATGEAILLRLTPGVINATAITPSPRAACGAVDAASVQAWRVTAHFGDNVLRDGMDPLSILSYLKGMGQVREVNACFPNFPDSAHFDAESCYLEVSLRLETAESFASIEQAFEFVKAESTLQIVPIHDTATALAPESREPERAAEIALAPLVTLAEKASAKSGVRGTVSPGRETKYVRVLADKLDALIDLVGELVIAGSASAMAARRHADPVLSEATATVNALVEEIRDNALRMRMVQIAETFSRFQRVVHDVSRDLGKSVDLVIEGGDTELDKSVIERIGDPLTHLVRNALDHGMETPEERIAAGKSPNGRLKLNAYHESGGIVIEVSDDGRGLKRGAILKRAIERGLVGADEAVSDARIRALIFEAGFSTAEKVTQLSGRGVGMDVVRKNIEALRGTVEVDSAEGRGTTFRIRLPLTLAIIDGFLLAVGDSHFVIPLDLVEECVEFADVSRQPGRGNCIDLRGKVLPVMRLREVFGADGHTSRRESVVVVQAAGVRAGIAVDRLMGEFQTVIKPLGKLFAELNLINGATLLGSGDVALILDVPALIKRAIERDEAIA